MLCFIPSFNSKIDVKEECNHDGNSISISDSVEEVTVIPYGIPLIPIDFFVKEQRRDSMMMRPGSVIRFSDAFGNVIYSAIDAPPSSSSTSTRRFLLDSSSNRLVSIFRYHDGSWKVFKGDGSEEEMLFRVERTLNTFNRIEFDILRITDNETGKTFKMRGCLFWRSCTIYQDNSIVAQTSLMYTLGFRKHFVRRSRFRVTVFPGFADYTFIVALILIFLNGRKQ